MTLARGILALLAAAAVAAAAADCRAAGGPETPAAADPRPWRILEPGLELGEFEAPLPGGKRRARIHVLRADTGLWRLRLLNTSAPGEGELHSAREWCDRHGLTAAINASMFQKDYRTSVSLMRAGGHVNNSYLSKDNTVLAFDARGDSVPPVRIIDRTCEDLETVAENYGALVQSIRMVSCRGNNVWSPSRRRHSIAAVGMDRSGRFLMIHCRDPFSTHDLIDVLLQLPLDLAAAMYVEGGPEAQLFVRAGGLEREFVGSFETGIVESDLNRIGWPVPNVIGLAPRSGD